MLKTSSWSSLNSTSSLNKGTTWAGKETPRIRVDDVWDVVDLAELGTEITFHDFRKLHLPPDQAKIVINELKAQLRARKDPEERSAHWEGYEYQSDVYVNAPHLVVPVYSFRKEMAILKSRMTSKEREALYGQDSR